jgi:DnaK suppressor protein
MVDKGKLKSLQFLLGLLGMVVQTLMEKQRLSEFKRSLLSKQQELLGLLTKVEKDGRVADEAGTQDLADKAANSYAKEFLFHQSSSERTTLQAIDEALQRIEQGGYGECVHCGGPIQVKRLQAVPWARHCVPCQELEDGGLL